MVSVFSQRSEVLTLVSEAWADRSEQEPETIQSDHKYALIKFPDDAILKVWRGPAFLTYFRAQSRSRDQALLFLRPVFAQQAPLNAYSAARDSTPTQLVRVLQLLINEVLNCLLE
jgi:hypothetical protein